MGTGVKGGVNPPVLSTLLGQQKGGGSPSPPPTSRRSRPQRQDSSGLFMLTLFSPQFKRSLQSQPSLWAQP